MSLVYGCLIVLFILNGKIHFSNSRKCKITAEEIYFFIPFTGDAVVNSSLINLTIHFFTGSRYYCKSLDFKVNSLMLTFLLAAGYIVIEKSIMP